MTMRCSPMTIHPDVSGRPQVLLMLERMYDYISKHAGVKFCTFDEIADDFRRRCPRQGAPPPKRRARAERRRAGAFMCALCGVLGGKGHWSDSAAAPGGLCRTGPSRKRTAARAPGAHPPAQRWSQVSRRRRERLVGQCLFAHQPHRPHRHRRDDREIWRAAERLAADASAIRSTKAYLATLANGASSTPAR